MQARAPEGPCCRGRGRGQAITQARSSIADPERPSRYAPRPSGARATRRECPHRLLVTGSAPQTEEAQPRKSRERGQLGTGQSWPKPYVQFLEKEGRQKLPLTHHIRCFWKTNPIPDSKASGRHPRGSRATWRTGPHEARGGAGVLPPGQLHSPGAARTQRPFLAASSKQATSHPPPPVSGGPAPRRPRPSAQGQLSPRGCRPQRAGHEVPGTPRAERTRSWARQPVATGLRLCVPSRASVPPPPAP